MEKEIKQQLNAEQKRRFEGMIMRFEEGMPSFSDHK
jgi:hypothetical protein